MGKRRDLAKTRSNTRGASLKARASAAGEHKEGRCLNGWHWGISLAKKKRKRENEEMKGGNAAACQKAP